MPDEHEISVDFMDMTHDGHLWARSADARPDLELSVGRNVVVGDDDADPKVARIVALDPDGNIELEVLAGSVESHADLLPPAGSTVSASTGSLSSTMTTTQGHADVAGGEPEYAKGPTPK